MEPATTEVPASQLVPIDEAKVTYRTLVTLSTLPSTPEAYQGKPQEMLAACLQGRELGLGPLTSINNIDVIDGTISMRAKLMSALIHGQGHIIKTTAQTREVCELECYRYHSQTNQLIKVGTVTYDTDDAEAAGDAKKPTYRKHAKAMLTNRAMTLAARTFYGDCLAGIGYTSWELGHDDEPDPIPVELELDEKHDIEAVEI